MFRIEYYLGHALIDIFQQVSLLKMLCTEIRIVHRVSELMLGGGGIGMLSGASGYGNMIINKLTLAEWHEGKKMVEV